MTTFGAAAIGERLAHGETRVVPSIMVSERYDSNVFFIAGQNLEDYVTTAAPQVKVEHEGRLVEGNVQAGLTANAYVRNPGLNYVAANGTLSLDLDKAVRRVVPRAGLRVTDTFRFTPELPAFAAPPGGSQAPEAFVAGIQAARANSFSNLGSATGTYTLSPSINLQATYTHQLMRFGTAFATPAVGGFFQTTFQSVNAGPQWQISPRDVLSLTYQYLRMEFSRGGGFGAGFETNGGILGWARDLTPTLKANAAGGLTVFGGSNSVQYLAEASLDWTHENANATLKYSRSVFPSFFIAGLPLLSQVYSSSVSYRLGENLTMTGHANYARNESVPTPVLSFESFGAGLALNYTVTRAVTASASYSYNEFKTRLFGSGFEFDRNQVTLSLRAEWK